MSAKLPTNTSILVAIAKIETKLDNLTVDVQDLKDGMKSDIENLKVDKISRSDAVRMQTEAMTRQTDADEQIDELKKRTTNLEDSRIAYKASLKVWIWLGGGVWSVVLITISFLIAKLFT